MNLADAIGCEDCQTVWNGICYLCKKEAPNGAELKKPKFTPAPPLEDFYAESKKVKRPYRKNVQKLIDAGHPKQCRCCGTKKGLTYDHIVPKSMGGYNGVGNGQILCYECNQIKADRKISIEDLRYEIYGDTIGLKLIEKLTEKK